MKSLEQFVLEKEEEEKSTERGKLKFTIWEKPDKKLPWIGDNDKFQKIECKYEEKPDVHDGIKICFLLGKQGNDWKLWAGKIGAVTYSDDPWCDLKEKTFQKAIIKALDKCEELIEDVKEHPDNWIQFIAN